MVLYITGICARNCFYCPLSEEKKDRGVIFANERPVKGKRWLEGIIEEVERMKALGTGITGGDPMMFPERTAEVIRALKKRFGSKHHIHLYTSGPFEKDLLERVNKAGLDEIRFHPPVEVWERFRYLGTGADEGDPGEADIYHDLIEAAREAGLHTGIEIPSIPAGPDLDYSDSLKAILDYGARENLEFINVNELEASHTNADRMRDMGYSLVGISMAVEGSRQLAWEAIREVEGNNPESRTVFHFCSSVYKDSVQMRNRLKRTAKNVHRPYEMVTGDGTILRGVVESDDPEAVRDLMRDRLGVPDDMVSFQGDLIHIAPWILEEIHTDIEGRCYLSEVYPTWDGLEVERIPLDPGS